MSLSPPFALSVSACLFVDLFDIFFEWLTFWNGTQNDSNITKGQLDSYPFLFHTHTGFVLQAIVVISFHNLLVTFACFGQIQFVYVSAASLLIWKEGEKE